MPVIKDRFKVFDEETNIASSEFGAGRVSDLINIADNNLTEVSTDVKDLIKNSVGGPLSQVKTLYDSGVSQIDKYSRDVRGVFGRLTDFKSAPESLIKDLIKTVSGSDIQGGNASLIKSSMDILRRCGRGSGHSFGGRPYNLSANCSGGKASLGQYGVGNGCNSSSMSDLLNKLSGNQYGKSFQDINSGISALMALSGYGYKLGMCGVFNSFYNSNVFGALGLRDMEYGKAAGALLGIMGGSSNTRGWIDIAKSSTGLNPKLTNPAALDELMADFAIPEALPEINQVELMEQLRGGQELFDEGWMIDEDTGNLSMGFMNGVTDDYRELSDTWVTNRAFGEDDLDAIPDTDDDFLSTAVVGSRISDGGFSSDFPEIWETTVDINLDSI